MAKAKTKGVLTKAKAEAQAQISELQIPAGGQYSETVEVFEFETRKGKDMEIYTMALDGKRDPSHLFKLFEHDGFKLKLGDICKPVIRVAASAYLDSRGQARPQNITVIDWVLSDGEVNENSGEDLEADVNEEDNEL